MYDTFRFATALFAGLRLVLIRSPMISIGFLHNSYLAAFTFFDATADTDQLNTQPIRADQKGFPVRARTPPPNRLKFYLMVDHVSINDRQICAG
jgi:hypothetical protein